MDVPRRSIAIIVITLAAVGLLLIPEKEVNVQNGSTQEPTHQQSEEPVPIQDIKEKRRKRESKSPNAIATKIGPDMTKSELESRFSHLGVKAMMQLLSSKLSDVERNYLEHLLTESRDREIDGLLDDMLEDAFLDLSIEEDELHAAEDTVFLTAATNRMNSAIRVTGLRGKTEAVGNIIDIASHANAEESTVRACYEAIGYLGTDRGKEYLLSELNKQKNPFLKSEIILSLTTAKSSENITQYLTLLSNQDTDLRNSAIVALGEAQEEKAVDPFAKMFSTTTYSSKVLIVQALKKIGTGSADDLLEKISQSHPQLVKSEFNPEE